jgi:hypothetical protein
MAVMTWMLAAAITLTVPTPVPDRQPVPVSPNPARLVVPCDQVGALPRALRIAEKQPQAEIHLRGVCTGNFKIERGSIGLYGMTPDSGLAAPAGSFGCVSTSCGVPTALAIEHGALAAEEQAATIPMDTGPRSLDRRF